MMHDYVMPAPLERLPDEPTKAHHAFCDYVRMGNDRSLDNLIFQYRSGVALDPPTRRRSTLSAWSKTYGWGDRAAAYDDHLRTEELAAREAVWIERRDQIRDESWELAQRLRQRALALLEHPTTEQSSQVVTKEIDGVSVQMTTIIIKPSRWAQRDIPAIAETFDKLARLSVGMDTTQQRIVIEGLEPEDLESSSDEELQKLRKQIQKKKKKR